MKHKFFLCLRIGLALPSAATCLFLMSCVSPGTQNPGASAGPDRMEMGKRAELQGELQKVFAPINEKSELLNP